MTYHSNDTYKSYKCILRPVALVISFFYKISYIWFLRSFFSDSLKSSTYSVETFCNCSALGTCFLSLGGACVFRFFFAFFSLTRYLCSSQTFHFSRDVCWPVVLMVAPVCMTKRKTCSHVRAKYRGREKNVKIKTVRFVLLF